MKLTPREVRYSATNKWTGAKQAGLIPNIKEFVCSDCGCQATEWDHRDYTKYMDVDPVCAKCNVARGEGYPKINSASIEVEWAVFGKKPIHDQKTEVVKFRLSDQELTALRKLAEKNGVGVSDLIRGLIRQSAQRKRCW